MNKKLIDLIDSLNEVADYTPDSVARELMRSAAVALSHQSSAQPMAEKREPDGYAYRYNSPWGGTEVVFNTGELRNGGKPIEAIPYYLGIAPASAQPVCPHIRSTDEGTHYCELAASGQKECIYEQQSTYSTKTGCGNGIDTEWAAIFTWCPYCKGHITWKPGAAISD